MLRNPFVNKLFWNTLVFFILCQVSFFIFGYNTTVFWIQTFIYFSANKILALFGSELDFSEMSPMTEWRIISFEEFLRHLAQSYKC